MAHNWHKMLPDKACVTCGAPFNRRDAESSTAYRRRKTCSRDCGHMAISKAQRIRQGSVPGALNCAVRYCVMCGKAIAKPATMARARYALRKFCSRICNGEAIYARSKQHHHRAD